MLSYYLGSVTVTVLCVVAFDDEAARADEARERAAAFSTASMFRISMGWKSEFDSRFAVVTIEVPTGHTAFLALVVEVEFGLPLWRKITKVPCFRHGFDLVAHRTGILVPRGEMTEWACIATVGKPCPKRTSTVATRPLRLMSCNCVHRDGLAGGAVTTPAVTPAALAALSNHHAATRFPQSIVTA